MNRRLERMTILAVHPGAELFGSDRMLLESVIGMVEDGACVVVAVPGDGPLTEALRDAGARVLVAPAFVLRKNLLKPSRWPRLATDLGLGIGSGRRVLARVRPDIVYVSTIIEPLWPLIGRVLRVPVVTHVHEAQASGSRLVSLALYLPHAASTGLIANSRFSREAISRVLPPLSGRARIVLNGVLGPSSPAPPRAAIDGPLRLVYVGRLSPRKGPDLVLEAARILDRDGVPVEVTLVGDVFEGYEWYAGELRARAAAMGGVTVRFAGFQPDIWPWVADADIMVVPSRYDEPFGNTVVEGVLALRPVLVADQGGLKEAAAGYPTTRLVAVDDAAALARGAMDLARHWEAAVAQTPAARDLALSRHSPAAYRAGICKVIADAVNR